jgi:hypothetical protein
MAVEAGTLQRKKMERFELGSRVDIEIVGRHGVLSLEHLCTIIGTD